MEGVTWLGALASPSAHQMPPTTTWRSRHSVGPSLRPVPGPATPSGGVATPQQGHAAVRQTPGQWGGSVLALERQAAGLAPQCRM